jgi:quinol monooxygenase YgiN
MFCMSIRMMVSPGKRMELSQAITSLMGSIRAEKGCQCCNFYQSVEDENELCFLGEWDSREGLAGHLRSKDFKVLLGAMHLLRKPHEMNLYEVVNCPGKAGEGDTSQECTVKQATG